MMPWALVFAADIAAGLALEAKNLRRKEMLGNGIVVNFVFEKRRVDSVDGQV